MPATTRGAVSALKFIMLNAAKHVAEVRNQARAVVLAGGTLQPVEEPRSSKAIMEELGKLINNIGHLDKSRFGLGRSGQKGQEYYQNLCMKAVNQSIGRAIRRIRDYAAILLVDVRYNNGPSFSEGGAGALVESGHASKLLGWIKERFQITDRFGEVHKQLPQFFK
ncbi:unnamed protein product [Calypogeia fissa]